MRRIVAAVLVLAAALALAGCLADGASGDEADPSADSPDDEPGPHAGGNATEPGNATDDEATGEPEGPWWNVTYTNATVEGTNVVVSFGPPLGDPNEHFLNVTDGARNLTLNLTAEDGELYVTIYEPDCQEGSSSLQGSDCSHRADTGGLYHRATGNEGEPGQSSWSTEDPPPGTWRIQVYKGDVGTGSVDYSIEQAILQPGTG